MADVVFSVSQINEYLGNKLYKDPFLSRVSVVGEVTNFSMSSVGHAFFSLKDEQSMLDCIVYDYQTNEDAKSISDGAMVKVFGRVAFYRKSASVQLVVEKAALQGVGDLYAQLEQTKKLLFDEGIFDAAHKKPITAYPFHIGVVTSAAGAALHDIINVATRRFEGIHITVHPAQVQGANAARQICKGIAYFNKTKNVDVIIVGRGGGSFEDLYAFNEECVARAVYDSDIPVVSAVGHETDFSLCDMAADLRAPTPSAAAELVVKDKQAMTHHIRSYEQKMRKDLALLVQTQEQKVRLLASNIRAYSIDQKLAQTKEKIQAICDKMKTNVINMLDRDTMLVNGYRKSFEDLNPRGVLKRGYAIVYDENNNVVTSYHQTSKNMDVEFEDGRVSVIRKD